MQTFDVIFGVIPAALQLALAIIMLRRREYRWFPFFFGYTIFSVMSTAGQIAVMARPIPYFLAHYSSESIYGLLALLCMAEIFRPQLELLYSRRRWLRYALLPAVVLALAGVGVWRGIYHPVGRGPLVHLAAGIYGFVIGVRCVESGLYFAGWGLRRTGWMAMPERPFTVLKGFGLAAFISLIAYFARYHFGPALEMCFRYLPIGAYILTSWLWLRAFWRAEPPRTQAAPEVEKVQALLDRVHHDRETLKRCKTVYGARSHPFTKRKPVPEASGR
jgi:hypothetical protein